MTREDAREFLIDMSYKLGNMSVEYLTEKDGEKMREAIKTLEQEPTIRNCFGCKYSKDNHNAGTEECHLCMWENQYAPTTKNDLGVDCISRADAIRVASGYCHPSNVAKELAKLPTVTPQEPKTGHWIPSHIPESILDECSECGFSCGASTFNYCPNCGAKMVEP